MAANVADDVAVVFGDVVLYVDNDKCFVAHHLLNYKTTWIKIAIESTIGGGELQDAVIRVGDAAGVVLLITIAPDHLL